MRVSVDLCLVPLGVGVSLGPSIALCQGVIKASGLDHQLGPDGTAIEGEWDEVFSCVKACHEHLHAQGVQRIHATVRVNTRTDRTQSFRDKVDSVRRLML